MRTKTFEKAAKRAAGPRGVTMGPREFWVEVQIEGGQREEHRIVAVSEFDAFGQAKSMPGVEAIVCVRKQPSSPTA